MANSKAASASMLPRTSVLVPWRVSDSPPVAVEPKVKALLPVVSVSASIADATPGIEYPRLVRAIGACPPEDVGGSTGYADFLEAVADPDHEAHADMMRWQGGKFDPEDAGIDRILESFERLAKKWAPKPRKPKTTAKSN